MPLTLRCGIEYSYCYLYLLLTPTLLKQGLEVRIARLQSDRTVLRELANQTTTGERAGYGGAGVTALQAVIANVNRELTSLRKRQRKHSKAREAP